MGTVGISTAPHHSSSQMSAKPRKHMLVSPPKFHQKIPKKLHRFIETLPAIIGIIPLSTHRKLHPAIIQPSCAGDKLPLLRPIFPAVRSMTSPRPRPMVSLSQLPKPPPRIDMPPSRPSCHVKKDGFTCSNPTKMPTYHQHPSTIVMQMSKMSGIHRGKHLWMSQKNDSRIA